MAKTSIGGPYSVQAPLLADNANIIEAVRLYHLGETGTTEYPSADSISGHLNTKANISGQVFTGNITATNVTATANLSVGNNLVVTSNFTAGNISVANITSSGNVTASGNLTIQGSAYVDDTFAQKVIDAGTTYNATTNVHTVDFALGSYFSNIALQRQTGTWTFVGSDTITFYGTNAIFSYGTIQAGDLVVLTVGTDGIANPTISGTGFQLATTTGTSSINAAVFYRQATSSSQNSVQILASNGIPANFAASAAIFRNSKIRSVASTSYPRSIVLEQVTLRGDSSSTSITGASMTVVGSNNLTVLSLYGGDGTWALTSSPTGHTGAFKTSNVAAAVSSGAAYDLVSTANTAVGTNWGTSSFSGEYATFALEFSAEVNPIIVVSNATALSSTDYKASAYVVDVKNSDTDPATNLSWSGITTRWAYGYEIKPGTSSTYRDTIYMFQTKDGGTTFRAAALVGYA